MKSQPERRVDLRRSLEVGMLERLSVNFLVVDVGVGADTASEDCLLGSCEAYGTRRVSEGI